jgi:uncharacterized phage-like protein YoqJ
MKLISSMETRLVNINKTKKFDTYIGRAGRGYDGYFGNPFRLEDFGGDRESCLTAYKKYFYARLAKDLDFRKHIQQLRGKTLGCFCWPDLCHGEVIVEHLDGQRTSVLAFTGHRPDKLGGYVPGNPKRIKIFRDLVKHVRDINPGHAITGMALGVDQWTARVCHHLGVPFTAAIPFDGQEKTWPRESRVEYDDLMSKAAAVVIVSELGPKMDVNTALQVRNEWMVDRCDRLLAVWDGSTGGTRNCVKFAELMRTPMTIIRP